MPGMAIWSLFNWPLRNCFAIATMTKKKFIQRQSVRKVSRSSLVRSPKTAVAESSSGRSSSSPSLPAPPVVGKAPVVGTSAPVVPLQKEDPSAAPVVTLVPLSAAEATSMRADLIILSSDSEDEVDWEALTTEGEVV